jgi:hypothetical protein
MNGTHEHTLRVRMCSSHGANASSTNVQLTCAYYICAAKFSHVRHMQCVLHVLEGCCMCCDVRCMRVACNFHVCSCSCYLEDLVTDLQTHRTIEPSNHRTIDPPTRPPTRPPDSPTDPPAHPDSLTHRPTRPTYSLTDRPAHPDSPTHRRVALISPA